MVHGKLFSFLLFGYWNLVIGHYLVIVSCILVIDLVSSFVTFLCVKTEKSKNKQFGQIRETIRENLEGPIFSITLFEEEPSKKSHPDRGPGWLKRTRSCVIRLKRELQLQ